jgi:fused signal recognition particle receptor
MSFFGKLKERLFKSSSKLDEGLEKIVVSDLAPEDTVTESDPAAAPAPDPAPQGAEAQPDTPSAQNLEREPAHAPEPEPEPESAAEPAPEPAPAPAPAPELRREPEKAPAPEPKASPTPARAPSAPQVQPPQVQSPQARPPQVQPPQARPVRPAPAAPAPDAPKSPRPGLIGRLLGGRPAAGEEPRRVLDDAMLESLEELLIASDMGVDAALRITANLAEGRMGRKLAVHEIKQILAAEISRIMSPVARPMPLYAKRPQVVLVVGVNGSGKTTTIGKLASQFRAAGKKVVIAAGDTFRAAAVEQLQVWGQRAGVPVLTAPEGSDPASLAFDAMTKAQADGADLLMIDTAGRLQNRQDLMEELTKIIRVIRKKDPDAPHNTLLVLDATTGQNAIRQVEIFQKLADVSGLVMTKLDGTAKGGVLVALADRFGLPIHAIGVGEQIDDLDAFDPDDFAKALVGVQDRDAR